MKRRNRLRLAIVSALAAAVALASALRMPVAGADDGGGRGWWSSDDGGHHPAPPPPTPAPPPPAPPGAVPPPRDAWAWTQLTPEGTQVRFATPATDCPFLTITTGTQSVRRRMVLESTVGLFPSTATVCTRLVPPAATAAQIDVRTSPAPVRPDVNGVVPLPNWTQPGASVVRPASIAEIGDTGCRIPAVGPAQICTGQPDNWPLQRVATNAATSPVPPNLVVHTGDYIYRTRPEQQPAPLCGGPGTSTSPHTWGCLVTDFFEPAQALLARAPFVFVRGNHETCGRSGEVWFRYLAPTPNPNACAATPPEDYSPPVRIDAGTLRLLLMDTSCAGDDQPVATCATSQRVPTYTAEFERVNTSLVGPGDNFLLSHTPIWAVVGQSPFGNPEYIDGDLEKAVAGTTLQTLDAGIRLILSGHVHLYQMLDFDRSTAPRRPPQVTVGDSGTALDPKTWRDADLIGKPVDGVPLGHLITVQAFGYAALRDIGTTWNLQFLNQFGTPVTGTDCTLVGTEFPACV
ncbi:metallophosphoesterase family protein [Micromonospora auratinigra]|uniref:Calcineurin-like phosphoesterase n=1 Tax=Micromonospora auratinigra TaxID=261654 RepID=A0A1A8ZM89_9ACTN|nr:metallophosphoesterase [Micromonospora auratinigra]SBT45201.1 Calcineurin-like phosphoesterase [Micromonospora auratinigra]